MYWIVSILVGLLLIPATGIGQHQQTLDALKYSIDLAVNDSNDVISVHESVSLKFSADLDSFYFDLTSVNEQGKGMRITSVLENGQSVPYLHVDEKVYIYPLNKTGNQTLLYELSYSGIPSNGLIIGENRFGDRTFFTDHWPDRAHHWMACIDHPSDKAKVQFTVKAPKHYECVATGKYHGALEERNDFTTHVFSADYELPVKVMAVGIADFSVQKVETDFNFPLINMVYDHKSGKYLKDLDKTAQILSFYMHYIDSFPYDKLINVQSTTMFGGMENAGNIFYDEYAFTGKGTMEALIAHEVAHQWFGNTLTEQDWPHFWLSEGFAVFLTDLYFKATYGDEAFRSRLMAERKKVIDFYAERQTAVVDDTYEDPMELLNPNSYQKGGWFLNMLYHRLGEEKFQEVIRTFYSSYSFSNATTDDFQRIAEEVIGQNLADFFDQWLQREEHPKLEIRTEINDSNLSISLTQQQENLFTFPLEVEITFVDGSKEIKTLNISKRNSAMNFSLGKAVQSVRYDPEVKLLFEQE